MKKGLKLFAVGAAVAAVAGLLTYKKYQDFYYEDSAEANNIDGEPIEDDFVPMEEIDDGFDYVIEDEAQILFYE